MSLLTIMLLGIAIWLSFDVLVCVIYKFYFLPLKNDIGCHDANICNLIDKVHVLQKQVEVLEDEISKR